MSATRINHVSIVVRDMAESIGFYEELFGAERVPTAKFPRGNVVWLTLGSTQLHLFESDGGDDPTVHHHYGIDVDDFDALYEKAKAMGVIDSSAFGTPLRSHPMGWVQLYLRDPAGNLIEVDWPDIESLDAATRADIVPLEDAAPQEGDAAVATLYHS
jgi:catechol 2,3-dioxygenase-like lactoylglutathione lyase family enzyme